MLTGCADDELPAQPELPPVQSLQANLTAVEKAPPAAKASNPAGTGDYTNFANAWLRVKVLQLYAVGVVLLPAAAIGLALAEDPVFEDGGWVWKVSALGATATARVEGNPLTGWDAELRVSNAELDDFLWVEGDFTGKGVGSWTLHDSKLSGDDAVLEIEWDVTSEDDYSLAYVNVNQQSAEVGDKLSYSLASNTAELVFTDASDTALVASISWDASTGVGSIEVPGYNEGQPACWGTDFKNAACP